ncbi:unnamed protein product [Camellia sinensis]
MRRTVVEDLAAANSDLDTSALILDVLEMEAMASVIRVSLPVLWFLMCFLITLLVSFVWHHIPSYFAIEHLFTAMSG